jgi:hypothetical protein
MGPPTSSDTPRWTLRELPLAARLALAAFLISTGIGYVSALVQLHFQHASGGELMPNDKDAVRVFHGEPGVSVLERLILAPETEPFSSGGSMRRAFTTESMGWAGAIEGITGDISDLPEARQEAKKREAEGKLRPERDGEALILAHWVRHGLDRAAYDSDAYPIPAELKGQPITKKYVNDDSVKLQTLLTNRCVRCHKEERQARDAPLDTYERIRAYARADTHQAMPLRKLAQSTHVHLLGFSMLYGLTGLILALTSWPAFIRVPLAPLALIAQVVDISFWWLARMDAPHGPLFATLIPVSGGVVALSLMLQILLSLWDLFGKGGRAVLLLLVLAAGGGAFVVKEKVIDPYMAKEKAAVSSPQ